MSAPSEVVPGVSEFGEAMAELLYDDERCLGAVLSDRLGDPIDTAYRSDTDPLDIQLAGAQIGQAADRVRRDSVLYGLADPRRPQAIVCHCARGLILVAPILHEYAMTLLMTPGSEWEDTLPTFEATAGLLQELLR